MVIKYILNIFGIEVTTQKGRLWKKSKVVALE